jgi:hypothetical protein
MDIQAYKTRNKRGSVLDEDWFIPAQTELNGQSADYVKGFRDAARSLRRAKDALSIPDNSPQQGISKLI